MAAAVWRPWQQAPTLQSTSHVEGKWNFDVFWLNLWAYHWIGNVWFQCSTDLHTPNGELLLSLESEYERRDGEDKI